MLSQLATPIMIFCMNHAILRFLGNDGINAYSVISYIVSFAFAVFIGVSEGMQPLFGQSYGDKNAEDLKYYEKWGMIISVVGSVVVYVPIIFTGSLICKMFGADSNAAEIAVQAIPQYCWAFIFASLNTILSTYLYSTKRTKESVLLNILRGIIFTPFCIVGLSLLTKGAIIWYTVGIAELITFVSALIIVKHSEKNGVRFEND